MIVLKIIGIILLSIFALIILALCVKVRIFAEYSEIDTRVYIKWLFIKIPLYPTQKKDKASAKSKDKAAAEASAEQTADEAVDDAAVTETVAEGDNIAEDDTTAEAAVTEENKPAAPKSTLLKDIYESHGVDGLLAVVKRIFSYIGTYIGKLMHSLVIDELYIEVKCAKNDAAETAIYYGEVCSAIFPMLGALVTKYKVRKYDINVFPDFLAKHSSASYAVKLHLYPIYLIGITLGLVFKLIFKVLIGFVVKLIKYSKNKNVNKTEVKNSAEINKKESE